ncbi:MAG: xanthine dehydrogenase family protein molybdopterin-binding subunit [Dehalococcoidia bacterium]
MTTGQRSLRVIGQRVPKVDAAAKVTGRALFGADIKLPGMLVGKVLRSPYAHARIVSIDTTKAEALPGVMAVIAARDMPVRPPGTWVPYGSGSTPDMYYFSRLVMARDKVLFHGHPVAAVAATSDEIAGEALGLINVEYEVLPPVLDPVEAMKPEASLLHSDLYTQSLRGTSEAPSNVALHVEMERGDVAEGFADADVVLERTYQTGMVHQGYIEPEAETADVSSDGNVVVWANTQGIFQHRNELSVMLDIPLGKIRVVPTEVGGAFGGKSRIRVSPICVLLSRKASRPVQITLSREEVLRATGPGCGTAITVKVGARTDGSITAIQGNLVYDAGAFPSAGIASPIRNVFSPYRTPHLKVDAYEVVTTKPAVSAYRAPGGTPTAFALESAMDEMAEAVGMDPVEFRLKNASRPGEQMPDGLPIPSIGLVEVLEQVKRHPCWTTPLAGPNRGRGFAVALWAGAPAVASCNVVLGGDGSVTLVLGTVDLSGTRTTLAQVAAEEMGLEMSDVRVMTGDTDTVGHSDGTGGDRVTYGASKAVREACHDLLSTLKQRVAEQLQVSLLDVEYGRRRFSVKGAPEMEVSLADIAARSTRGGGAIIGHGSASGMRPAPMAAAHVVDLEVDRETGKVRILSYTAFQDVGLCVNPVQVEGQMQGGSTQGIGWALTEGYSFNPDGALANATLLDYRLPTSEDVPFISTNIIEVPSEENPYGIRGAGQVSIVPPAPAIAGAIYRATGLRLRELPMSAERLFWALKGLAK